MSNQPLGTVEQTAMTVTRYRDATGNPTCAADFSAGRVCMFYRAARMGSIETCVFAPHTGRYPDSLRRRPAPVKTLIPLATCPVWKAAQPPDFSDAFAREMRDINPASPTLAAYDADVLARVERLTRPPSLDDALAAEYERIMADRTGTDCKGEGREDGVLDDIHAAIAAPSDEEAVAVLTARDWGNPEHYAAPLRRVAERFKTRPQTAGGEGE